MTTAYVKTVWTDEVPDSTPVKYEVVDDVAGEVAGSATITPVTGITAGTPLNATNLNHLETGVYNAAVDAAAAQASADAAADDAAIAMQRTVQVQLGDADVEVTTSLDGYFFIPTQMNGMVLVRAQAFTLVAGTTNPTTVQVRNMTKYSANDALSGAISIASGAVIGTPGTVNTTYDDVATDDQIKVYITAQSTLPALGLVVVLEYEQP
jgi:hypothetical protein